MAINILGGHAKGHALFVPPESITRPTSVMLRRKFFDSHQNMQGMTFIDLCAGSGSMAFEALSRSADKVILVEENNKAVSIIKKNLTGLSKRLDTKSVQLIRSDILKFLKNFAGSSHNHENTSIFLDPPYELKDLYFKSIKLLQEAGFEGDLWIESDRQKGIVEKDVEDAGLEFSKIYKQGTSFIAKIAL